VGRRSKYLRDNSEDSRAGERARTTDAPNREDDSEVAALIRRHQWFGWRSLLFFVLMGLFLESLHGFKVGWYLDAANTTRRHMWTLAHAHGTLLAVLNLILAGTLGSVPGWSQRQTRFASTCLLGAGVLLPTGFFLGGCFTHGGDPGVGIALVPVGAVLLVVALFLAARG